MTVNGCNWLNMAGSGVKLKKEWGIFSCLDLKQIRIKSNHNQTGIEPGLFCK